MLSHGLGQVQVHFTLTSNLQGTTMSFKELHNISNSQPQLNYLTIICVHTPFMSCFVATRSSAFHNFCSLFLFLSFCRKLSSLWLYFLVSRLRQFYFGQTPWIHYGLLGFCLWSCWVHDTSPNRKKEEIVS